MSPFQWPSPQPVELWVLWLCFCIFFPHLCAFSLRNTSNFCLLVSYFLVFRHLMNLFLHTNFFGHFDGLQGEREVDV